MIDWISVEDKLPNYQDTVLVWGCQPETDAFLHIGMRTSSDANGENWVEARRLGNLIFHSTHWAEMPNGPPIEEQNHGPR